MTSSSILSERRQKRASTEATFLTISSFGTGRSLSHWVTTHPASLNSSTPGQGTRRVTYTRRPSAPLIARRRQRPSTTEDEDRTSPPTSRWTTDLSPRGLKRRRINRRSIATTTAEELGSLFRSGRHFRSQPVKTRLLLFNS